MKERRLQPIVKTLVLRQATKTNTEAAMDKIIPIYRTSSFKRIVLNHNNFAINNLHYLKDSSRNRSMNCCNTLADRRLNIPLLNHIRSFHCLRKPRQVYYLVNKKFVQIHDNLAIRKQSSELGELKIGYWPKPEYKPNEVYRSEFLNGIRVAAAKHTGAQMGACTIMFRAGSRCESGDELGASHFLRAAAALSGCAYSGYIKTRYLQQHGAYITTSSDRQTISYTLRCPIDQFANLKHYLLDTAKRCKYDDYELHDVVKPLLHKHLQRRPMEEHCMDLVQQGCWLGPLNNSVYCNEHRIEDMSQKTLVNFRDRNFKTSFCSVGSCGIPAMETAKFAESIELGKTEPSPEFSEIASRPRGGYEIYDCGPGDTYIALAVPNLAATTNLEHQYTYALLAETLGTCHIQSSEHSQDRVPAPPLGMATGYQATLRAFSVNYRDCGVFGIMVKTTSKCARDAAFAAAHFFHCIHNVTDEQICVGKKRLKLSMCLNDEDCVSMSEGLALQAANGHSVDDARVSMACIDQIYPARVRAAAQEVHNNICNMAMAVVGDVDACPDDKELIR